MIPVVDVIIGFLQEQTAEASTIEWTPSAIILLSVIGLAVLVQLFHLIKGDALSPPTVEADEQAAGPSSADVPTDTPVSMPDAEGLSDTDAVELGIQSWRLQKRVNLLPLQDHPKHKRRLDDSVSQINRLLQKCRIEVEDPIGQIYTDGWV
ncbi:MAG: hypothetical protein MK089_12250, partial [Phycisphaerales bacterium]|nr:hypothetical protein [Phycisphaerales bacterium]